MTLEEVARLGNDASAQLCASMLDRFGPGREYECAIGSAATTLLFHVFRVMLPKSKDKAIEVVGAVLGDVAHNIRETSGDEVRFAVEKAKEAP